MPSSISLPSARNLVRESRGSILPASSSCELSGRLFASVSTTLRLRTEVSRWMSSIAIASGAADFSAFARRATRTACESPALTRSRAVSIAPTRWSAAITQRTNTAGSLSPASTVTQANGLPAACAGNAARMVVFPYPPGAMISATDERAVGRRRCNDVGAGNGALPDVRWADPRLGRRTGTAAVESGVPAPSRRVAENAGRPTFSADTRVSRGTGLTRSG